MLGFVLLVYYFLFFPALTLPVPLGVWLLCMRIIKRKILNPFSLLDFISPIVSILIWEGIDACLLSTHKRMGNFIELVGLGCVWAVFILFRLCVLFVCPSKSKWPLVLWSNLCVLILAVIFAFAIPATIE